MSVPKLRFKEFDEAWISTNIQGLVDQNILDKPMDGNHGEIHPTSADYVENGIPFVMATDVFDGNVYLDKSKKITKEQADTLRKGFSIEGDILLTHKATIGNVAKVPKLDTPYIMLTPQVTYYRVIDYEKLVPDFIKSSFESKKFQNELIALCTGATRLYIGISEQRKLPFSYPSKSEQTKIASFLSAVDEKISQLTQKHELLSQYKQGMMQKLFSQKIRFKADDGSEFGEWVQTKLDDLIYLVSGFAFKSDFFSDKGKKLITPKNFTTYGKANFTALNTKWTSEVCDEKYICFPDDLLILLTDLTQSCELLGKPILLSDKDGVVLLNQRISKVIKKQEINKNFLLYLFLTDGFHELVVSTATGTTVKHSSNKIIESYKFGLPCLAEQAKIANYLSVIDQKIEVISQQIKQTKEWKKGLLQQMFI
ncbi:restriction endonuclease subunit S [Acinetobacter pittii]|uniref:restriction endonuclease subunit S n=1 Tax=Acinetobacter pittii TaxID=48296 RepID=UPI00300AD0E8